jgi:outer membrane protein TolC
MPMISFLVAVVMAAPPAASRPAAPPPVDPSAMAAANALVKQLDVRGQLNQVMAQPANTPIRITDSLPDLATLNIGDVLAKADTQNPQVLAAKTNLAILLQAKREVTSQRLPSATIGTNYNFFRNRNAAGFTLLNQNYGPQVNFGLALPLFNAGNVKRQEKVATLDIKSQQLAEQQLRLQLSTLVQQAFANYENGKALFELETTNLLLAEQNNQINLERFRKQYITAVELRQSQLNYANARNRQANARFQLELAGIELRLLSGDILTDLVQKLN